MSCLAWCSRWRQCLVWDGYGVEGGREVTCTSTSNASSEACKQDICNKKIPKHELLKEEARRAVKNECSGGDDAGRSNDSNNNAALDGSSSIMRHAGTVVQRAAGEEGGVTCTCDRTMLSVFKLARSALALAF